MAGSGREAVAVVLAALTYGQRLAQRRAESAIDLAPDPRAADTQRGVAAHERENLNLLEARLDEVGSRALEERFHPFFEAFFERTQPGDWVEAQTFHYVGDALVSDFAEAIREKLDRVTAQIVQAALLDRDEQDAFALDQLTESIERDPRIVERVAAYARTVAGEALTQTRRALDETGVLREFLGGEEGEKRTLLDLLERHRRRLDRLGIEPVED